jgi:hypothetical protein
LYDIILSVKRKEHEAMKLSKKNAALQRAMQKAIASGKALGGLLVGITAATVAGGCREHSPASTMGSYPRPQQQANATNENIDEFFTDGEIVRPEDIAVPEAKPAEPKPNAVQERQCEEVVRGRFAPMKPTNDVNEVKYREVFVGDI